MTTSDLHAVHEELPLFPLRAVFFPDGLLELKVFETRYLDLMSRCMREQRPFGVVALKEGAEVKTAEAPAVLDEAGTLAELIDVDSAQTGILLVRARGGLRFTLQGATQRADGLWVGRVATIAADATVAPGPAHENIVESLAKAIASLKEQGAEPFLEPHRFESAGWVANRWCEILPLPREAKQLLLMLDDPLGRLDVIDSFMRSQQPAH